MSNPLPTDWIIGTSAYESANTQLMKDAGIRWVRTGFSFPFADRIGGALTDNYLRDKEHARQWIERGFRLIGSTPGLGIGLNEPDETGKKRLTWKNGLPDWVGQAGSEAYYSRYAEACAFLAQDLRGMVPVWQIGNELDVAQFAGPLNLEQACELVLRSAVALKSSDHSLKVGTNAAGAPYSYYQFARLYHDPRIRLDYCGIDQYYGSWQDGGPELWGSRIAEIYAITETPVFVNEWGFSSAGEPMTPEEFRAVRFSGAAPCTYQRWLYTWSSGHTWENQAEYIRLAFDCFKEHQDKLIGICFYRWEDQETCWQCGSPTCPMETAWGLVDPQNNPKPAYAAFKEGV
ncbi:MAG: hypothetical protein EHM21_01475, partial [Chloroflexi bacterium]